MIEVFKKKRKQRKVSCHFCKNIFITDVYNKKFCSQVCHDKFHYLRKTQKPGDKNRVEVKDYKYYLRKEIERLEKNKESQRKIEELKKTLKFFDYVRERYG